jgi:hypothetical protein
MASGDHFTQDDEQLASPFELWCEQQGVHPEHPLAFDVYLHAVARLEQDSRRIAG